VSETREKKSRDIQLLYIAERLPPRAARRFRSGWAGNAGWGELLRRLRAAQKSTSSCHSERSHRGLAPRRSEESLLDFAVRLQLPRQGRVFETVTEPGSW